MIRNTSSKKGLVKPLLLLALSLSCFLCTYAFATQSPGIGQIATNVTNQFSAIGQLMIAVSYLAGIGFAIAAIFKFKQHKDNPTQIPLGTPIALLVIGIVLIFLPSFIKPAGASLFGQQEPTAGGFKGSAATSLPGGSQ